MSHLHLDEARYGRACLLVLNICPFTLRHVIADYYKQHGSLSFQDFLLRQKHTLFHLLQKCCCCRRQQSRTTPMYRSQWELLYMRNTSPCQRGQPGDCPCQHDAKPGVTTDVMDVTLCCLMIKNTCRGINMLDVDTIRKIRNNLIHAESARLDQTTYNVYWNRVKGAVLALASHVRVPPTLHSDTINKILELKNRVMDPAELGELKNLIIDGKRFQDLEENVLNINESIAQITMDVDQAQRDVSHLEMAFEQGIQIVDLGRHIDDHGRQMDDHGRQIDDHGRQMDNLGRQIDDHGRQINDHFRQIDDHGRQMDDLGRQTDDLGRQMDDLGRQMDDHFRQIDDHGRQIDDLGRQTDDLGRQMDDHGRQIDDHGRQIGDHGRQMDDHGRQIDDHFRQIDDHGRQIDEHGRQIDDHGRLIGDHGRQIGDHGRQMDDHGRQIDEHGRQIDDHGRQMDDHGRQIDYHGRQIDDLGKQMQSQKAEISNIKRQMPTRKREWRLREFIEKIFNRGKPNINKLRQILIKINDEMTQVVQLSPLQVQGEEEMPLELLYASVVIREDPKYAKKGPKSNLMSEIQTPDIDFTPGFNTESNRRVIGKRVLQHTREVTPDSIFKVDGKLARNIYMLGDAAHGKTTYCMWLLKKWCNAQQRDGMGRKKLDEWEKALHKFDFVFLLQFRYVDPNLVSVIDMICQNIFEKDTDCYDAIRHVLSSDNYRSLIIMDGLDEWNPNERTKGQLACKVMPKIPVSSSVSCFFSMRPWVFQLVNKVKACDRVIEIFGLSETGMKKVIENVLLNRYKLKDDPSKYRATYNKIVRHLKEKSLKSFMQIPLLAVVCVQIWYKEKQVGDSMTSFYAVMVDMLIERSYEKHELKTTTDKTVDCKLSQILSDKENITNHISVLLKLGKVAYEGLLSKETNLVFQKRKLQREIGEEYLQFALDVGLISQKEASSLVTKNVSVHFFHKSIQEFLAVIYIVTHKEVSDSFCEHLSNVMVIMELSNVIMFLCGMCPSLGSVISQRVVSVTDSDTEICRYRESPWKDDSKVEELYKLQVSWYRELQYGQTDSLVTKTDNSLTQTDSTVTQTDRPVTFHVSDVYLGNKSDTETVRVTRELLSDDHVDIRSLWLQWVPTDGERGVTNTVLGDFLSDKHRTRSLVKLYINGYDTPGRSVPPLCGPSLRYLYLNKVTINTDLCGNVCPPLLTDTSQLRVLKLWDVNLGEGGLGLSPNMVHIERIELYDVTLGEGGLGLSPDMVHIERIKLWCVTLDERGLGLSPDMVHIEMVLLVSVNMPTAGWGEFVRSVSQIQHRFNVELYNTNIDDVSMTMIRSSPDFTVTLYRVDEYGRYELHFTRVWPPSQLTKGNVLLYTRLSPL